MLASLVALSGNVATAQTIRLEPQVIASQGGNFKNSEFELSYTIGELAAVTTITNKTADLVLTQGFHQPDKFSVVPGFNEFASFWSANVYPNPADEQVWLNIRSDRQANYYMDLFDAAGRNVIVRRKLTHVPGSQQYAIPTQELAGGAYLLRISTEDGQHARTFRITRLPH